MENPFNEIDRPKLRGGDLKEKLPRSLEFEERLIRDLEERGGYDGLEVLDIDYSKLAGREELDGHIVIVITIVPPQTTILKIGELLPESHILTVKAQRGRFDEEKWGFPMGKVEWQSDGGENQKIEDVLTRAAERERAEEVEITPAQKEMMLGGTFFDKKTGYTVHTVITNVVSFSGGEGIKAVLPDLREHSESGWVKVEDFVKMPDSSSGARFALLNSLREVRKANLETSEKIKKQL